MDLKLNITSYMCSMKSSCLVINSKHIPLGCSFSNFLCAQSLRRVPLTLCDPVDWGPPGSTVNGIFQAVILELVGIFSPRGSSWPRDRTHLLHWQADSLPLSHLGSPSKQPVAHLSLQAIAALQPWVIPGPPVGWGGARREMGEWTRQRFQER